MSSARFLQPWFSTGFQPDFKGIPTKVQAEKEASLEEWM